MECVLIHEFVCSSATETRSPPPSEKQFTTITTIDDDGVEHIEWIRKMSHPTTNRANTNPIRRLETVFEVADELLTIN